ncbi:MAG: hypothetical protein ACKN94_11115, partial [Pirellulaceae bacterium]
AKREVRSFFVFFAASRASETVGHAKTRRREEGNQVILVINIETVNFPVGQEDDTTIPVAVSDSFHRQFIRVWYRSR